jgi:cell division protein FtsL
LAGSDKMTMRQVRLVPQLFRMTFDNAEIVRASHLVAIIIAALVLIVGMFYVWHRMQLVQIGYEISSLEDKNRELKKRSRELMLEISSLQSPGELERKAARNGLVVPSRDRVVHVP